MDHTVFDDYVFSGKCFLDIVNRKEISCITHNKKTDEIDPFLKKLIDRCFVTYFESGSNEYLFFESGDNGKGILSRSPSSDAIPRAHSLHQAAYSIFGTIIDYYSSDTSSSLPYAEVLSSGDDIYGLPYLLKDSYEQKCKEEKLGVQPELLSLTTLALEANGNLVQYDSAGNIIYFLADHPMTISPLKPLSGCPVNTFYTDGLTIEEWLMNFFSLVL